MNKKPILLAGLTLTGVTVSAQEVSRRRDVDFTALKVTQQEVAAVKGWREGQMDKSGAEINAAAIRPDGTLKDDAFEVDYVRVFDPEEGGL